MVCICTTWSWTEGGGLEWSGDCAVAMTSPVFRAVVGPPTFMVLIDSSVQGQAACLMLPSPPESQAGWRDQQPSAGPLSPLILSSFTQAHLCSKSEVAKLFQDDSNVGDC